MTLGDLSNDPNAIDVRKRPTIRQVVFARGEGVCQTLEGGAAYRAGDAIVTGERGERWPVGRAQFLTSYVPVPPLTQGLDGTYASCDVIVRAKRLDQATSLLLDNGGELFGDVGDWLIQHKNRSHGIVRSDIFAETYEII